MVAPRDRAWRDNGAIGVYRGEKTNLAPTGTGDFGAHLVGGLGRQAQSDGAGKWAGRALRCLVQPVEPREGPGRIGRPMCHVLSFCFFAAGKSTLLRISR